MTALVKDPENGTKIMYMSRPNGKFYWIDERGRIYAKSETEAEIVRQCFEYTGHPLRTETAAPPSILENISVYVGYTILRVNTKEATRILKGLGFRLVRVIREGLITIK